MIKQIELLEPGRLIDLLTHLCDRRPKWNPLSPITIINQFVMSVQSDWWLQASIHCHGMSDVVYSATFPLNVSFDRNKEPRFEKMC